MIDKLTSLNRSWQSNKGTFRASGHGWGSQELNPRRPSQMTGPRFRLSPTTLRISLTSTGGNQKNTLISWINQNRQ